MAAATTRCATSAARSRRKCSRPSCCGSPATRRASSPPPATSSICPIISPSAPPARSPAPPARSPASGSICAHERRWPQEFFAAVGLEALGGPGFARIGAEIVAPGTALGRGLAADAAAAFGLPPGVPVGAGLIDAHAGALATLGAARGDEVADPRRRVAVVLGTSACCMAVSDEARFIPGALGSALFGADARPMARRRRPVGLRRGDRSPDADEPGLRRRRWAAQRLRRAGAARSSRAPAAPRRRRGSPAICTSCPIFSATVRPTPIRRRAARSSASTFATTKRARWRSMSPGCAAWRRDWDRSIRLLERNGFVCDALVASGGAARSALVRQIVADAIGRPVAAPETSEPVLLGAAMLGAVAAGRRTLVEAMSTMSRLGGVVRAGGRRDRRFARRQAARLRSAAGGRAERARDDARNAAAEASAERAARRGRR